jgi:MFS transporter, DHA1 family, multidrug resistance protein
MYFALAAAAVGVASLLNAKLVMRLGMRRLTWVALLALTVASFAFWAVLPTYAVAPPLALFLSWQMATFLCVGIMFGNLSALSLEPFGHMAGLGAAFVGSLSTFISLPLAWMIGDAFDGTVYPLTAGFAILGLAACGVVWVTERKAN